VTGTDTDFRIIQPSTIEEAARLLADATQLIDSPHQATLFSAEHQRAAFARGARKPRWVWAAVDSGERTIGVVAGWGSAAGQAPGRIDLIDVPLDRPAVAAALLDRATESMAAGGGDLEIDLFGPPSEVPEQDPTVACLVAICESVGYRTLVVRRRFELDTSTRFVVPQTLLRFEPATGIDDPRLTRVYAETLPGTLDAHSIAALGSSDPQRVADEELQEIFELDDADGAVRLAIEPGGEAVGLVVGGFRGNAERAVASFVGVSHRHRGRGYARQLLGWISAELTAQGARKIIGETDVPNRPMAAAFTAIGYRQTDSRIDLVRPR
jgi:ribosomal protein S18 acetylase RimI-like enzyme